MRVDSFSTIADKDNHAAAGTWRSAQALNVITLHKRAGEDSRYRVNISQGMHRVYRRLSIAVLATLDDDPA